MKSLNLNQWKDSNQMSSWFKYIQILQSSTHLLPKSIKIYKFICPAIHQVTDSKLRAIKSCRKSLLYDKQDSWKKKITDSCFDVTMESYDGAEACGLVGTYILPTVKKWIKSENQL